MKARAGALILLFAGAASCAADETAIYVEDPKGVPAHKAVVFLLADPDVRVPDNKNRSTDQMGLVVYKDLDPALMRLKIIVEHHECDTVVLIESKGVAFPKKVSIRLRPPRPED
jgi:hypothetical protein